MAAANSIPSSNANQAGVASFGKDEELFVVFQKIASIIKATWPKKTAAHVAHLTGYSERAVQFWLAGETGMPVEAVRALLRTPAGFQILSVIMGDCSTEWWVEAQLAEGVRQSRRAIRKQEKRLAELKALRSQVDLFDE